MVWKEPVKFGELEVASCFDRDGDLELCVEYPVFSYSSPTSTDEKSVYLSVEQIHALIHHLEKVVAES